MDQGKSDLFSPWASSLIWREANSSIAFHIRLYRKQLSEAVDCAFQLKDLLFSLDRFFFELGRQTCVFCPDSCCLKAKVWYDFKDLLFIHLIGERLPPGQPVIKRLDVCRYLTPKGCRLPRILRPWICTWYSCPTQKKRIFEKTKIDIDRKIISVKKYRNHMENEFLTTICNGDVFGFSQK